MTWNRRRGLRRGQDVHSPSRGSDKPATPGSNSSNFDEENFWTPLEKNYFSQPSSHLIRSIKNAIQVYKIVGSTCHSLDSTSNSYSIELRINRCKRYRDAASPGGVFSPPGGTYSMAKDRDDWLSMTRRNQFLFNPEVSPKYFGRGYLPMVMRPSPDYLGVTLMDSPLSLHVDVLTPPTCSNYRDAYDPNDGPWALHPRFSPTVQRSGSSCFPPYKYQKFSGRAPLCSKCYGLQLTCGESPPLDFNIRPAFPEYCFIPGRLPIDRLRSAMSNVDAGAGAMEGAAFSPVNSEGRRARRGNGPPAAAASGFDIEQDFCSAYEFYSSLLGRIGRKLEALLRACESEARPDYESWRRIELEMVSQYMLEYERASSESTYTYTSALQLSDIERLRLSCPDSSRLPSTWTEKALCAVCATADDWDDNPIMFCDCCYLPTHVKCVASEAQETDEESWICALCAFLFSQLPQRHAGAPRPRASPGPPQIDFGSTYDVIRKLGTCHSELLGSFNSDALSPINPDPSGPRIPISDVIFDKFVRPDAAPSIDLTSAGWPWVRDPRVYARMCSADYPERPLSVPFCMLCGFSTLCVPGGPALPTSRPPLWAHVKCALTVGISPRRSGDDLSEGRRGLRSLYHGRCFLCKRWGVCLAQCSSAECTKFFHVACVTSSRECLYEWDTVVNKPDILCQVHAKGVSPNSLLRRVQQRLEGEHYKKWESYRKGECYRGDFKLKLGSLGIYARDFLEADKSGLLELFKGYYLQFKGCTNGDKGTGKRTLESLPPQGDRPPAPNTPSDDSSNSPSHPKLLVSFNSNSNSNSNFNRTELPHLSRELEELVSDTTSKLDVLKVEESSKVDEDVDVSIPFGVLPTPSMLLDIFTDLPSFQTAKYSTGVMDNRDITLFRSVCEGAVVLSQLFNLSNDVKFVVNVFNYISKISFYRGAKSGPLSGQLSGQLSGPLSGPEAAKAVNSRVSDQYCSGCGIVENRRVSVRRCGSCMASICRNCFSYGVSAARSTSNCTNSQFEGGVLTCARCYKFVCGRPFGSCDLCGRLDGFLFAGVDCLVHLICAQLLIPPKCWADGLRLGKVRNPKGSVCYYCRLNIGLTSTCASPTCGVRFHPYCAFVLKGHSKSSTPSSEHSGSVQCVSKKERSKSEVPLKAKKPGVPFSRILCVVHGRDDAVHLIDFHPEERRAAVLDFFRGIDYNFHGQGERGAEGAMDGKKRGGKKPDLRKFLTMQEIMQYGHSGRTSDDNYYCPICFSLYYETNAGLPGDDLHWIGCDGCERWFHWICIGYSDNDPPHDSEWFCATCKNPKEDQGAQAQH